MRRLLVVNALIFAVLAAAAALAYYGYSATTEQTSRDRELALMQDLAEEKVANLEFLITEADSKLLSRVEPTKLPEAEYLRFLRETTGAAFTSIYVLDDQLQLMPSGYNTTRADRNEGNAYRDWFLQRVLPMLELAQAKPNVRGHFYLNLDGRPYLFSYMKRVSGSRTFYVVIEDDMGHLTLQLFPQFFAVSSKRLYQVVDENGVVRAGDPFGNLAEGPTVERKFVDTLNNKHGGWSLRVAQKDLGDQSALERKRLVNSILIGGAVVVILGGLLLLGFAIRRERRLSELKSEFISNVSHELKTPLSIISMFGEMLANGRTKSPEQAHEYAEIIWRESVRLGRLIDNVLDFAKMERGMDVYEFGDDVDITEVVARAVDLSTRRVAAAEMTVHSELEAELPLVKLDANAFTLAVLNLIDNAVKYAVDGKKIEVSLRRDEDRLVLAVRDWGSGIDPEEQERIFERFYRARSIRLKPIRGSGIGLALVQHIARAHGGDVTVVSTPDQGSTFSIWLPIDGKT
ncbi:MAG: HAMP domain-containing histidine kinase [Deltaproteobacteria bacterium]|nr:HAMP domain-containing histidine kinase [Deltaproteobacteria bacterium]